MAEGFAASIFLFDTLSEIGLVSGTGPSSIMSMKTDSAVALKQLGTQSVTVRTRTAAQKLNYLRELIYDDPQVEPIYISGDSQRADGLTKILSGSALKECQKGLNLLYPSVQSEEHDSKGARTTLQSLLQCVLLVRKVRDQDRKCKNMCIMFCHRSHCMVQDRGGANRRKGRPGGEAPEGQAQSTTGQAHGPRQSVKQKQEIAEAKMKALQHIEVSSSSTSSASKSTKAQGKSSQRHALFRD